MGERHPFCYVLKQAQSVFGVEAASACRTDPVSHGVCLSMSSKAERVGHGCLLDALYASS
jgi:hypothetical protein